MFVCVCARAHVCACVCVSGITAEGQELGARVKAVLTSRVYCQLTWSALDFEIRWGPTGKPGLWRIVLCGGEFKLEAESSKG